MTTVSPDQVKTRLETWLVSQFDSLSELAVQAESVIEVDAAGKVDIDQQATARLEELIGEHLVRHRLSDGAGLIFSTEAFGTGDGHLIWLVHDPEEGISRYNFEVNPRADRYYDYERLEWFTKAFTAGTKTIAGPYIDYLGVEEYIVTLTAPIHVRGHRVAVVGTDIRIADLELELLRLLRALPAGAALVNVHDSIVVGSSTRFLSGDQLDPISAGYASLPLQPYETGLRLVYAVD